MANREHIGPPLLDVDYVRVDGYKPVMPRDPNELAKYREAIAALEVADPLDHLDQADIYTATGALGRLSRRRAGQTGASVTAAPSVAAAETKIDYTGLSISEAAEKFLRLSGKAQRAAAIIEALTSSGYEISADKPVSALKAALERRAKNYNDVFLVRYGTWTHRDNLTDKDRATLEHKARTSRGMAAARERGVHIGPALKITPEMEAKMERLIEQGWSITKVAKKLKISTGAVRLRFKGERLLAVRKRGENKDRPNLRVVGSEEERTPIKA